MEILRQFADAISENIKVKDQLPNTSGDGVQLQTILNYVYAIMGMVAVVTIIYNATVYLTSHGDPGTTKKATQGILFSIVGLGIILLAVLLTNFIFTTIGGAQQ